MSVYPFYPGNLIVGPCEAFFKVLNSDHQKTRCNTCFRRQDRLRRCLTCMRVRYCSEDCRLLDLKNGHKFECNSQCFAYLFQSWAKEDHVALFRLYAMNKAMPSRATELHRTLDGGQRSFNDLKSNYDLWKTDSGVQDICADLVRHLRNEDRTVTINQFIQLYGVYKTNSFEVLDGVVCLGRGIYIQASVFQHSCRPNASISTDNGVLEIRALNYIPRGELPQVSYLNPNKSMSKEERRRILGYDYKFNCLCKECLAQPQTLSFNLERLNILNQTLAWYMSSPEQQMSKLKEMFATHNDFVAMLHQISRECNLTIASHCTDFADALASVSMDSDLIKSLYTMAYHRIRETYGPNSIACKNFFLNRPNLKSIMNNDCCRPVSGPPRLCPPGVDP